MTQTMAPEDEALIRDNTFDAIVRSAEDGTAINAIGKAARDLILELKRQSALTNTRKKGTLTIKLNLTADPKDVVESEFEIASKAPKFARQTSVHFVDSDGDILSRRVERQLELSVREGGGSKAPADAPKVKAV